MTVGKRVEKGVVWKKQKDIWMGEIIKEQGMRGFERGNGN